ncbi:MAG: hypothetical protein AVDCRST_MAG56-5733, partial [uncultured Cytophagales bacterium]
WRNLTARGAKKTQSTPGERVSLCAPCASIAIFAVQFSLFLLPFSPC